MKKKKIFIAAIIILLFMLLHITPEISLRTHLFFTGSPKIAFTSNIEIDTMHQDLVNDKTQFLRIDPPPIDKPTNTKRRNYEILKVGFLYFSFYYREG